MQSTAIELPQLSSTDRARFWGHVSRTDTCWLWDSANSAGYGTFSFNGIKYQAHRLAYMLEHGYVPSTLDVLHTCDVGTCVNPVHLYLGTDKDNSRDREDRQRHPHTGHEGIDNPSAKLDPLVVADIRYGYTTMGISGKALAARFGVSKQLISLIVNNKIWIDPDYTPPARHRKPVGYKLDL